MTDDGERKAMTDRFQNKWALITGAGSGIGEATTLALAKRGCHVWMVDKDGDRLAALQHALRATGVNTRTSVVDVSDRDAMTALRDEVHADVGPLSILLNNAGYAVIGSAFETTLDQWDKQLGVNLMGVIYGAQLFGPEMAAAAGPASIINIASAAGFTGMPLMSAYSVSKCAVVAYSQSVQAEWEDDTLHVAAICPGFLPTRIGEDGDYAGKFQGEKRQNRVKRIIAKDGRGPDDVAAAIIGAIEKRSLLVHVYGESWQLDIASRLLPSRLLRRLKQRGAAKLGR